MHAAFRGAKLRAGRKPAVSGKAVDAGLPLIGLARERRILLGALRKRESWLVLGPAGSGKTALVKCALESAPPSGALVYVAGFQSLHELLLEIARGLLQCGHQRFRRLAGAGANPERWLSGQTSLHLRGLLWEAFEAEPATVVLDGVNGAGHSTYRFLQRLYMAPNMALIALARNVSRLGELGRLFWDPGRTLHLQPLTEAEAGRLFETAAAAFGLQGPGLEVFREKVLESAAGNPGQIVEMCRLAVKPEYVSGNYIKFALVRIDAKMRYLD